MLLLKSSSASLTIPYSFLEYKNIVVTDLTDIDSSFVTVYPEQWAHNLKHYFATSPT